MCANVRFPLFQPSSFHSAFRERKFTLLAQAIDNSPKGTPMRKLLGLSGGASRPFLRAVMLLLLISPAFCHAQSICDGWPFWGGGPSISSISPTTWIAGQTTTVTMTGYLPCLFYMGANVNIGSVSLGVYYDGQLPVTTWQVLATPDANDPPETATLVIGVEECGFECPPEVSVPVQIIGGLGKNIGNPSSLPGSDTAGDPISICSGDVFEKVTDYETAGQNKLNYIRYYNSLSVTSTLASELGANWRSNYDRYLQLVSSDLITAERPDGQLINFYNNGGSWTPDSDVDYTLTQSGTTLTLTDHGDTTEVYSAISSTVGLLESITLRNGYTQTLGYNTNNNLTTVTDSYGRSLSFTYSKNGLVKTLTTADGQVLTYGYTNASSAGYLLASIKYPTTPATSQHYLYQNPSQPAALTSIQDENGAIYKSWTYDSMQRGLTSQTAGMADLFTVTYYDDSLMRTVTNALGVTYTYALANLQNDLKITNVSRAATSTTAAASESFTYDANGYLSSKTDWNGNQTTYVNDNYGDPTSIVEAAGSPVARTTTITYDTTFVHLPDQIVTDGLTTNFIYDANGNLVAKALTDTTTQTVPYATNGQTRTWSYTWNNALLASVTGPRTDLTETTKFGYDDSGALTLITNPLGQKTSITSHTGGGLPETIVDANNVTATLGYDNRLRLISRAVATSAGALTTNYEYDRAGDLTSVTLPDASKLRCSYDQAHRLISTNDLFGQSIQRTLDALGDVTATNILNANGSATMQHSDTFDALGRMNTDQGASGQASSYGHDNNDNVTQVVDQLKNKTFIAYDALNRITAVTDPNSGITNAIYDAHNRVLTATSPNRIVTSYLYDGFGDLIQESNPNAGTTVYTYDSAGNQIKSVTAAGATRESAYDALNRVVAVTYPADASENVKYTYDESDHGYGVGRLTSVTDAVGTLTRDYDEQGNLLDERRTSGDVALTTAYSYDKASRIAAISYPSGASVSYTRDKMGRVSSIATVSGDSVAKTVASKLTYAPFGPLASLEFGNKVSENHSFDLDYRLASLTDTGKEALRNLGYSYYANNTISNISDSLSAANTQSFVYDALNRLTGAAGAYGGYQYAYDGDGNRLTETWGAITTNYGYAAASDQLTGTSLGAIPTATFTYTAGGRLATLSPGLQSPSDVPITGLHYNQAGQLAAAKSGSEAAARYRYDGFGQRAVKHIEAAAHSRFIYGQNGMLLEETNGKGEAQADYIYLNGAPVAVLNSNKLYYLHTDQLGTPRLATNDNEKIVWKYDSAPFGEAPSVSGTITQNLRLPGQYFDRETSWNHNGFRDYAPELGRYIEPDPLGFAGSGANLYQYADDNPISRSDPTGLATYLLLVGQPGLGVHNVGGLFDSAAQTYANQLAANGDTAITVPVSNVQDMAAALTSNGYIDGGVTYFGHSGLVGDLSGLFLGQDAGFYTNLTSQNIGLLSGANLGPNASLRLRSCHAGYGNPSIAQSLANQLNRGVYAYDTDLFFSNDPNATYPTTVSPSQPTYLIPHGGVPPIPFTPK
jgi:RHS repeat-associated protein